MKKEDFLKVVRGKAKADLTEQEISFFGSIGEAVEQAFESDKVERNKLIEGITAKLGETPEGESIAGIIRSQAKKIDDLEAKITRRLTDGEKNIIRKALEDKKDIISKIARRESRETWEMQLNIKRAASAMHTTASIITGAQASNNPNTFEDVEIEFIRYPANFVRDAISSRQVSKVPVRWGWKEEITAGVGDAAVVAEGDEKPMVDFKLEWKYSNRKKYAGRIELTEEAEIDFDQLLLDIFDMFESKVLRKYNDGLLTDILAWAPTYTGTALDGTIKNPMLMNVITAGRLQLNANEYNPDTLFINPADYATTQTMQNASGDPILIADSVLFPGLRLFVSNKVAAGTCVLGEGSLIKEQHSGFILRQGVYGNQFIENEKTIIGELFSCLKMPIESKKGWVKLNIAAVKEALASVNA